MGRQPSVLVLSARTDPEVLPAAVDGLRSAGVRVLLAAVRPGPGNADVDQVRDLAAAAQAHGPAFRRALRHASPPERVWLHVEADATVTEWAHEAVVVLALDRRARLAASRLAKRFPGLEAAESVTAAVQLLGRDRRPGNRNRPRGLRVGAKAVLSEVRTVLVLDEEGRAARAARAAVALLEEGDEQKAVETVRAALERIATPRVRADLLGDLVSWALAHGIQPVLVQDAYAAELAVSDLHQAAGEHDEAAASFAEAMRTAFHRVLHFDAPRSPLADDPAGFTAPLRRSAVAGVLRGGDRAVPETVEDGLDRHGPTRLLIATQHNDDFLHEIRDHFCDHPNFETRYVAFAESAEMVRFARNPTPVVSKVLAGAPDAADLPEAVLGEHLGWADVVLVEWCTALAALVSRVLEHGARIVVRMHSYEAFTQWPHLTDFGAVDDVVFVSEHLRDLATAAVPGLQGPRAPRLHVIANAMELQRFSLPKPSEARFTLGVVGASKVVKDPLWALEVLRELRRHDERYRLVLVRGQLEDDTAATADYARALSVALDELPAGAVEILGHTDDVPEVLRRVGVVVSSSVRESFHIGLVEGAASGAVPVVRDWPFFPGAARQLFPVDWVVDTPAGAAARILAVTATEETWRDTAERARAHVLERWDWPVVRQDLEALLVRRP